MFSSNSFYLLSSLCTDLLLRAEEPMKFVFIGTFELAEDEQLILEVSHDIFDGALVLESVQLDSLKLGFLKRAEFNKIKIMK